MFRTTLIAAFMFAGIAKAGETQSQTSEDVGPAAQSEAAAAPEAATTAPAVEAPKHKNHLHTTATSLEVRLNAGVGAPVERGTKVNLEGAFDVAVGLGDRLQLSLDGIAYRFGEVGKTEWVPYAGFASVGLVGGKPEAGLRLSLGLDSRIWLNDHLAFAAGVVGYNSGGTSTWGASLYSGLAWQLGERLVINVGASETRTWTPAGQTDSVVLGSVLTGGGRRLPLVGVRLTETFWLEANAWFAIGLGDAKSTAGVTGGIAWIL
jgi:hypothetical protein